MSMEAGLTASSPVWKASGRCLPRGKRTSEKPDAGSAQTATLQSGSGSPPVTEARSVSARSVSPRTRDRSGPRKSSARIPLASSAGPAVPAASRTIGRPSREPACRCRWSGAEAPHRGPLMWLRDPEFVRGYRGKLVVFGHTPTPLLPQELSHYTARDPTDMFGGEFVLGLDTRCGHEGGFLTAVELPALDVFESR